MARCHRPFDHVRLADIIAPAAHHASLMVTAVRPEVPPGCNTCPHLAPSPGGAGIFPRTICHWCCRSNGFHGMMGAAHIITAARTARPALPAPPRPSWLSWLNQMRGPSFCGLSSP